MVLLSVTPAAGRLQDGATVCNPCCWCARTWNGGVSVFLLHNN
jgi:hypothetical protein